MKSFIDCHCHAFNFVDIPMYLTFTDKIKMGTIGRLKAAAGALIYLPKLIADKNLLKNKILADRVTPSFLCLLRNWNTMSM